MRPLLPWPSAACCKGFQRGQPTARGLRLLAQLGQFGLCAALLFLQFSAGVLAQLHLFGQRL